MKKLILIVLSIFFSSLFFAQNAPNTTDASGKKQGHWLKVDAENKKIYDGNFIDNVPTGKFTYFRKDGSVWSTSVFSKNGTKTHTKMINSNGKLLAEGNYVNQKKDSIWIFYNQEGILLAEEGYLQGLKHGVSRVYYPSGQLSDERHWKNNIQDGSVKKYFENGQMKYSGNCINGKVDGLITYYHITGKIDAQGQYVNDVKHGPWNYYKEDGTVLRTDTYVNGKMTSSTDTNKDRDVITKEKQEEEKRQYEHFEVIDPFQEGYQPQR